MIRKHWNLLAINQSLKETFNWQPITSFKRNKNLKELTGNSEIEKNKVRQKQKQKRGKCSSCLTNKRLLLRGNKLKNHIRKFATSIVPGVTLYI